MSLTLSKAQILFRQRLLKCCGLYDGKLDSQWGPKTEKAEKAFIDASEKLKTQLGAFDTRSEQNIMSLHLKAQELARKFLTQLNGHTHQVKILSGTRTYEEQDNLYKQGRWGRPGPIVTSAKGGESNHNFCIAWDIGLFDNGKYLTGATQAELSAYDLAAQRGLANGLGASLEWGGNWKSFKDRPHYQVKPTAPSMSGIRKCFEAGTPYC
jgi:peptidoglycan L-alanyl-D-glutamate endopeptidase CwlK